MHRNHQSNQKKYVKKSLLQRFHTHKTATQYTPKNFVDIESLYEDIRQNLEALLNARIRYIKNISAYPELMTSLARYGLKDFMHASFGTKVMQNKLCDEIKEIIGCFEPRVINTQVTLQNSDEDISRILKIRIEGTVKALNEKIPAVFESSMDLSKHTFSVE